MMALASTSPRTRAMIEEAIDASLQRIAARCAPHGASARALADGIARAASGGKRLRPALVAGAFDSLGGRASGDLDVAAVAAAFEILHTAFVIHDDVIDHDTHRRGIPNISGEFRERGAQRGASPQGAALLGDTAAILAGDLLIHESTRLVATCPLPPSVRTEVLHILDDAILVSMVGELADVEHSVADVATIGADDILTATANKTAAYTFAAPLEVGAVLAGADLAIRATLHRVGTCLGLAFQLVDDLIGAFGQEDVAGRGEGGDLREAKQTQLIALARETAQWPEVSSALAEAHTGPVAVRAAQEALTVSGARRLLEAQIRSTLDDARALARAGALPSETQALLHDLVDGVEARIP